MGKIDIHCLIDILENNSASDLKISLAQFIRKNKPKINFSQLATESMVLENLDENSFFIFITEGKIKNFADFQNLLWSLPSKILIALLPDHSWGFSLEQENFIKEIQKIYDIDLYLIYKSADWNNFLKEIENKIQNHIDNEAGRNSVLTTISRKSYQGLGIEQRVKVKDLKIDKVIKQLENSFKPKHKILSETKLKTQNFKSHKIKKLKLAKKDNKANLDFRDLECGEAKNFISFKKKKKSLIKKNLFFPKLEKLKNYFYEPVKETPFYTQVELSSIYKTEEQAPEFNFKNTIIGLFSALLLILAIAISPIKSAFFLSLYFLAAFFLNPNKKSSGIRRFFEILIKILFYGLIIIWDFVLVLLIPKTAILFFAIPLLIVYLKIKYKKITKQEGVKNFFIYSFIVDWIAFIL